MPAAPTDPNVADWLDDGGGADPATRRSDEWSPAVVANAVSKLNAWTAWLGATPLLDAGPRQLRAYLAERKEAGVAPATRRKDWQMIRAFYTWAATPTRRHGGGLLGADPMADVRPPKVAARPTTRAAKPDEVAALEDYFEGLARQRNLTGGQRERARRNVAMVSLMFRSGLRSGEVPWIDLADRYDHHGHPAIRLWADHTKTGEPRRVPVHPETERYLARYLRVRGADPGPLFRGRVGYTAALDARLSATAVQRVVRRAAARVGVPVSAHQLRRGFTAQYLRAGGDVLSLEVVGGWADHRMPRLYLGDEEADAALDRYFAVMAPPAGPRRLAVVPARRRSG